MFVNVRSWRKERFLLIKLKLFFLKSVTCSHIDSKIRTIINIIHVDILIMENFDHLIKWHLCEPSISLPDLINQLALFLSSKKPCLISRHFIIENKFVLVIWICYSVLLCILVALKVGQYHLGLLSKPVCYNVSIDVAFDIE